MVLTTSSDFDLNTWHITKEILLVANNVRPTALIMVHDRLLLAVLKQVAFFGLQCYYGVGKVRVDNSSREQRFIFKGVEDKLQTFTPGLYRIYITKDANLLDKIKKVDASREDAPIGEILGYPACCVQYFCTRYSRSTVTDSPVDVLIDYFYGCNKLLL